MTKKLVAFDFDGVLADSYSGLPDVYREIQDKEETLKTIPLFDELMLAIEDIMDYLGIWDPYFAFRTFIGLPDKKSKELASLYWEGRIKKTKIEDDAIEVLSELQKNNVETVLLSGTDVTPAMKLRRIEESGLDIYFNNIYIHGRKKGIGDLKKTIELIMEEYEGYKILYVDDKTKNLNKLADVKKVVLVLKKANVPFQLKLSWREPLKREVQKIEKLSQLLKIVENM